MRRVIVSMLAMASVTCGGNRAWHRVQIAGSDLSVCMPAALERHETRVEIGGCELEEHAVYANVGTGWLVKRAGIRYSASAYTPAVPGHPVPTADAVATFARERIAHGSVDRGITTSTVLESKVEAADLGGQMFIVKRSAGLTAVHYGEAVIQDEQAVISLRVAAPSYCDVADGLTGMLSSIRRGIVDSATHCEGLPPAKCTPAVDGSSAN